MNKFAPLYKGITTGVLMAAFTLILYYTKLPGNSPLQFLAYAIYAGGILWTIIAYSGSSAFTGKFAELFGQGFRCFIIVTLIMVAFSAAFSLVHPEFAEEAATYAKEQLAKEHNKTPGEIEEVVANIKKQYILSVVSVTIFRYLIVGALFTAAGAGLLITRRKE